MYIFTPVRAGLRGLFRCGAIASTAVLVLLGVAATPPAQAQGRLGPVTTLGVSRPADVAKLGARFLQAAPENQMIPLAITLPLRSPSELTDFLKHVYTPGDPLYHHFITTDEFHATYGPTQADYDEVTAWAKSQGLIVTGTHPSRTILDVEAPVSVVNKVFGVRMNNYRLPDGRLLFTNDQFPHVPDGLASKISGVVGLTNESALFTHTNFRRSQSFRDKIDDPLAIAHQIGNGPSGALTPSNIKAAYGLTTTNLGDNENVALFELDTYDPTDIAKYETQFGIATANLTNVPVDGFNAQPGINQTEVVLDIDMVLALAPKAHIFVYTGANSSVVNNDMYQKIADDFATNYTTAVSSSWGINEATGANDIPAESAAFAQMAAQGQTMYAAAGDRGAYDNGASLSVDDPPSQPNVTAVGGTTLAVTGAGGSYVSETTWNESPLSGLFGPVAGGGGISSIWPRQSYESGVLPTIQFRTIPDVSLNSDDRTGYDIFVTFDGGWEPVGGTSAAAPLWAGYTALINELRTQNGVSSPLGFANPTIYTIGGGSTYNADFHDIADGSTNLFYSATTGFDMATGWGTFKGDALLKQLGGGTAVVSTGTATLTGLVSDPNSVPIPGAKITAVAAAGGAPAGSATTDATGTYTVTLPSGIPLNISADGPPAGAVKYEGFTVAGVNLTASSTNTQNFTLIPALTFQPNTVQLISVPFDYTGIADFATLFGVTNPLTVSDPKLFYWDPATLEYVTTPASPADTFHLGLGYWAEFPNNSTLWFIHNQGVAAATDHPFSIGLHTGWNMIGDPFPADVSLSNISVDSVPSSIPQPLALSTLVSLPLFAYVGGTAVYSPLDVNTDSLQSGQGYWIFANVPATLIVTPPNVPVGPITLK